MKLNKMKRTKKLSPADKQMTVQYTMRSSRRLKDIRDSIKRCTMFTREPMQHKNTNQKFSFLTKNDKQSQFMNLLKVNHYSNLKRRQEESNYSFSSSEEDDEILEEDEDKDGEKDARRAFLVPSMNPHHSVVSSNKSFIKSHDVIDEGEEDEEAPLKITPRNKGLNSIRKNFTVVKSPNSNNPSVIANLKQKFQNNSTLITLKRSMQKAAKNEGRNLRKFNLKNFKSISPMRTRKEIIEGARQRIKSVDRMEKVPASPNGVRRGQRNQRRLRVGR